MYLYHTYKNNLQYNKYTFIIQTGHVAVQSHIFVRSLIHLNRTASAVLQRIYFQLNYELANSSFKDSMCRVWKALQTHMGEDEINIFGIVADVRVPYYTVRATNKLNLNMMTAKYHNSTLICIVFIQTLRFFLQFSISPGTIHC